MNSLKTVVMNETGGIVSQTYMTKPKSLSVPADDVIYATDAVAGVHETTDVGMTLSHAFSPEPDWQCEIEVTTVGNTDENFVSEHLYNDTPTRRISVFTIDRSSL